MDPRLTDIDLMMRTMDTDDHDDSQRELAFAILAVDVNDHATLNWLAACCAKRAGDLTGYEPDGASDPDIFELLRQARQHPDYVFGVNFVRGDFPNGNVPDDFGRVEEDMLAQLGNQLIENMCGPQEEE